MVLEWRTLSCRLYLPLSWSNCSINLGAWLQFSLQDRMRLLKRSSGKQTVVTLRPTCMMTAQGCLLRITWNSWGSGGPYKTVEACVGSSECQVSFITLNQQITVPSVSFCGYFLRLVNQPVGPIVWSFIGQDNVPNTPPLMHPVPFFWSLWESY